MSSLGLFVLYISFGISVSSVILAGQTSFDTWWSDSYSAGGINMQINKFLSG